MPDICDLSALLNWKLLSGAHKFPGPDGGTCINEAAIVVAGFEYRKIANADDCPSCFSRPIAAYAIKLNDRMSYDLRQELLMPFVTRLAGTADSVEIERQRADVIVIRTVNDVLPIVLRLHTLEDHARLCERARTRAAAYAAANKARDALRSDAAAAAAIYAADAAIYAAIYAADAASADAAAADAAADAAIYAADAYTQRKIWTIATHILDSALRIGKQAEPIETAVIVQRAAAAKQIARAA